MYETNTNGLENYDLQMRTSFEAMRYLIDFLRNHDPYWVEEPKRKVFKIKVEVIDV